MNQVVIVDYGMGNINSVANALKRLGASYFISDKGEDLKLAKSIILPGVGGFGSAMNNIRSSGLEPALQEEVINNSKPFLGICLGMQVLASASEESRDIKGLGWIPGKVVKIKTTPSILVPQVGWNEVNFSSDSPFFDRISQNDHFYFDHSYHLQCDPNIVIATCDYGDKLVSGIQKNNIVAVQFHPEKSQRTGLKLLRNFLKYIEYFP
jgi:imidazole glycerol-phosphate synthase subunit HisH